MATLTYVTESLTQLDQWEDILRQQYVAHEIDATLYASLSEDLAIMRRRFHG